MKGSNSRAIAGDAPHRMPSGTPSNDEIRKPQKMTWIECHRLEGMRIASPSVGGWTMPFHSASATSCGAGR